MRARGNLLRIAARRCNILVATAGLVALFGCGGSSGPTTAPTVSGGTTAATNVLAGQVNGGPTTESVDQLFVTVKVCVPNTTTCETIPNVLVDSGSEGLKILQSEISLPLPAVTDSSGNAIGNCITYVGATYTWGAVVSADVEFASEKASAVPIAVLDANNFAGVPTGCESGYADDGSSTSALGAAGLLGVGVFRQDCGPACASGTPPAPAVYFGCPSSGCVAEFVPVTSQLQNPVWMFPQDNNGLMISLPSISSSTGASLVNGSLIFGIGTESNNSLGSAAVYDVPDTGEEAGDITTNYNGQLYPYSFIDSGSNGIFFLDPNLISVAACTDYTDFYCPTSSNGLASIANFTVTNSGTNGTSVAVTFGIGNADSLFNISGATAFNNLGGPIGDAFDFGLGFFFGRPMFIGIEGQSTSGGTGPYFAY